MRADFPHNFFSGLSGLSLPIPQYLFPPPFENASRLSYYSSLFNSIEINSSFYKIPRAVTIQKWVSSVGPEFRFTFKLYKGITHTKGFYFSEEETEQFFKSIEPAVPKKGCILLQLPPSVGKEYSITLHKLLTFIQTINTSNWNIAVEFRNRSWYTDSTYHLLSDFNSAIVLHDIPKSSTPVMEQSCGFVYQRFHGPTGNYRDSYDSEILREHATYLHEWINSHKEVYVYFNNTIGDAFNNLKTLNALMQEMKDEQN